MPQRRLIFDRLLLILIALFVLCPPARAADKPQHHGYRRQIERVEEAWRSAILNHDGVALAALLSDDFTAITANGAIQSREELIASITSGNVQISSLDITERKIRIYGTTAVVTSAAELTGTRGLREMSGRFRYTRVYIRTPQEGWKIVSFEASRILDPADRR